MIDTPEHGSYHTKAEQGAKVSFSVLAGRALQVAHWQCRDVGLCSAGSVACAFRASFAMDKRRERAARQRKCAQRVARGAALPGWMKAVKKRADSSDDSNAEGAKGADEIAALERCPRLHLLSPPQLISVLHMTDPQELNDKKLWKPMCDFDRVVMADSTSSPLKFAAHLPRSMPNDVEGDRAAGWRG